MAPPKKASTDPSAETPKPKRTSKKVAPAADPGPETSEGTAKSAAKPKATTRKPKANSTASKGGASTSKAASTTSKGAASKSTAAAKPKASKPKASRSKKGASGTTYDEATQERISKRAYEIYQERGGHHGRNDDDWYQAEREVLGGEGGGQ